MKIEEIIIKKRTKRYKIILDMDEYKLFAKGKLKLGDCEELYIPVSREQFISEMKTYANSIAKIFCKESKKYISIETTEIHEGVEELNITPLTQIKKLILPKSLKNIEIKAVDSYYYNKEIEIYYNGNLEDYCNLVFKTKKYSCGYTITNTFTSISQHLLIQKDDGEIEYNGKKYSAYENELDLSKFTIERLNPHVFDNWANSNNYYNRNNSINFKFPKGLKSIGEYSLNFKMENQTIKFEEGLLDITEPSSHTIYKNLILPKSLENIKGQFSSSHQNGTDYIIIQGNPDLSEDELYLDFSNVIFTDLDPEKCIKYLSNNTYSRYDKHNKEYPQNIFFSNKYSNKADFIKNTIRECTIHTRIRNNVNNIRFVDIPENRDDLADQIPLLMSILYRIE